MVLMSAADLVEKAQALGATFQLTTDSIKVRSREGLPEDLRSDLEAAKPEVVEYLRNLRLEDRYQLLYPDGWKGNDEFYDIAYRVQKYGMYLVWSEVLQDHIAFYASEAERAKVPVGFVPYSGEELLALYSPRQKGLDPEGLRRIHAAKRGSGSERGGIGPWATRPCRCHGLQARTSLRTWTAWPSPTAGPRCQVI